MKFLPLFLQYLSVIASVIIGIIITRPGQSFLKKYLTYPFIICSFVVLGAFWINSKDIEYIKKGIDELKSINQPSVDFPPVKVGDVKPPFIKVNPKISKGEAEYIKPNINIQPQPKLAVLVSNYSKKETVFKEITNAQRGDELFFRITVENGTNDTFKDLAAYIQIPFGLSYVKGYTKLYFTDEKKVDRAAGIGDYIAEASGAMIGSIPPTHYEYIVYKVKVAPNAPLGTYATGNQVFNGSGINVSINDAKVIVTE